MQTFYRVFILLLCFHALQGHLRGLKWISMI
nr:MAG TPA: hypothetical protein [Caudoviricetes sp.]